MRGRKKHLGSPAAFASQDVGRCLYTYIHTLSTPMSFLSVSLQPDMRKEVLCYGSVWPSIFGIRQARLFLLSKREALRCSRSQAKTLA